MFAVFEHLVWALNLSVAENETVELAAESGIASVVGSLRHLQDKYKQRLEEGIRRNNRDHDLPLLLRPSPLYWNI